MQINELTDLKPRIYHMWEENTGSMQYILVDESTSLCAIIDPVLDFDQKSCSTSSASADKLMSLVSALDLSVAWIIDTHPHADHLSAAGYLHDLTGAPTATGEHVVEVQKIWREIYQLPKAFATDGSQWDRLLADGEILWMGDLGIEAMHSPGHTLSSISLIAGNAAFVHDTVFMPDAGTARADFPGGDAGALWDSIQRILALPDETEVYTGHDYRPGGRPAMCRSTVAEQRTGNKHLVACQGSKDRFVEMRTRRDKELPLPDLMLHALQVNIAGGRLPPADCEGRSHLRLPLNAF